MKRLLAFLLVLVILILPTLTSCMNRSYDAEEVKAAAEKLLEQSKMLNSVYFGDGIHHIYSNKQQGEYYFEADPAHLAELGFSTIAELKALTAATFSSKHSEKIFKRTFGSTLEGGGVVNLSRYFQEWSDSKKTVPSHIMVYKNNGYSQLFDDMLDSYHYDSLEIVEVKGEILYLTVDLTVHNEEGDYQDLNIRFTMIEEAAGWRLNSDTYANYNEYLDSEYFK